MKFINLSASLLAMTFLLTGCSIFEKRDSIAELEQACHLNDGVACSSLATLYKNGKGVRQDNIKAMDLYQKSCDLNVGEGCSELGTFSDYGGGRTVDYSVAIPLYEKACNLQNGKGCYLLARAYDRQLSRDEGVDYSKPQHYFEKACDLNYAKGCTYLWEYYEGNRIDIPRKLAQSYLEKACNVLKDGESCSYLGFAYDHRDKYVKRYAFDLDYDKAKYYYEKACDFNDSDCYSNLSILYEYLLNDPAKGLAYLKQGCALRQKGHGGYCMNVSGHYLNGIGVRQNIHTAKYYCGLACDLGEETGCRCYKSLNEQGF